MKFKSLKTLALVSTAVLGICFVPVTGEAANNADVTVNLTTDAGITALNQSNMNFGSWTFGVRAGDNPTITMAPTLVATFTTNEAVGSDLVELTGATAGTRGAILVTLPAGADGLTLQMQRGAITQFADTNITLSTVTYRNTDVPAQTGPLALTTNVPITITTGATGSIVGFGGTITATATPVDNVAHSATMVITFAF